MKWMMRFGHSGHCWPNHSILCSPVLSGTCWKGRCLVGLFSKRTSDWGSQGLHRQSFITTRTWHYCPVHLLMHWMKALSKISKLLELAVFAKASITITVIHTKIHHTDLNTSDPTHWEEVLLFLWRKNAPNSIKCELVVYFKHLTYLKWCTSNIKSTSDIKK